MPRNAAARLPASSRTDLKESLDEWPQLKDLPHGKKALESLPSAYAEAQSRS
jgi:hypothetical protein